MTDREPTLDDEALVDLVRRDRSRGGHLLFDRYARRIERLLFKLLGPTAEVAERLSDVFLVAIDRITHVTDPSGLERWLVAIAVRVAQTELRARRRRRWLSFGDPSDYESAIATVVPVEEREALARIFAWIDELSPDDRTLFVLRRLEGLELTEVAAMTEVSLATVKRHLARLDERFQAYCARDEALATRSLAGARS